MDSMGNQIGNSNDIILFFSTEGNFYHLKMSELPVGEKTNLSSFITTQPNERICAATILGKKKYILFVTKQGIIKKSELIEYSLQRSGGARAITLNDGDKIVDVIFLNDERIGIATAEVNLVLLETADVRATGRTTKGIKGIKLNDGDFVVSARAYDNDAAFIISISRDGLSKKTAVNEFVVTGKNTKGKKLQKIIDPYSASGIA